MSVILVVDGDPHLVRVLDLNLRARRYAVRTAGTGREAIEAASRSAPDAVLLDPGLPDADGFDAIRALRAQLTAPIIVLSARESLDEKVRALDAGADDYLTKPFLMDELLARLRAVLRRPAGPPRAVALGRHVIDLHAMTVTGPGGPVRLTPIEWRILAVLLATPGRLVPRRRILHEVWGPDQEEHTNYLRVYLRAMRAKLEADPARPRHLITEPGLGYRFDP
ncbi:response regulator [Kitasatospora sp. NPDC052896]|uniref:response regulator n=1 Tax=Kitasatospora sp. NPDC052896 TaxID=3364061 RepID=UPI0037C58FE5